MQIICKQCSKLFEGRKDALYCSDACRKAHKRNVGPPELDSQLELELELEQLRQILRDTEYKYGFLTETLGEFFKDYPHMKTAITDDYFGRVLKRRKSQGEAQELERHLNNRSDSGQKADK